MGRFKQHDSFQLSLVPSIAGFGLPVDHPVRFFNNFVEEELNLSNFFNDLKVESGLGRPAYHPLMMIKLIIYGYAQGITSVRGLAQACVERLDFRFLTGNQTPDHRSISRFRKKHLQAFAEIFEQSVEIAAGEGLIEMKDVAVDGTKILANASKRKAMSYARMLDTSRKLKAEIYTLKQEVRVAETKKKEKQLAHDLQFKRCRIKSIRVAKKALEGRVRAAGGKRPEDKAQINFTDADSRIMKVGGGFEQCFNAQAAVDKKTQIIIAAELTQDCNDKLQIKPILHRIAQTIGLLPERLLADCGYFSEANIEKLKLLFPSVALFIPPSKQQHGRETKAPRGRIPGNISTAGLMRRKLSTKLGKEIYAQRKAVVEPVFGQIKSANLQFDRFSFRGFNQVSAEWKLVCAIHNFWKICRARAKKAERSCSELAA